MCALRAFWYLLGGRFAPLTLRSINLDCLRGRAQAFAYDAPAALLRLDRGDDGASQLSDQTRRFTAISESERDNPSALGDLDFVQAHDDDRRHSAPRRVGVRRRV